MTQLLLPSGQFCTNLPFLKAMRMDVHIRVLTTIITRVRVDPCTTIIDFSTWMYGTNTQLYMFQEVPGHVGIEGNEAADEEAKAAARGASSGPHLMPKFPKQGPPPRSFSSVVEFFNKKLKESWRVLWRGGKRYQKMKKIDPKLPSRSYLELVNGLTRRQLSIVMQLRAGHLPLNSYLHWITKRDSPDCSHPRCAGRHETVFHFLLECPAYNKERREILGKHGRQAEKILYLLGDPKCIKDTVKFISETRRFGKPR
jgi:hypothetical protein